MTKDFDLWNECKKELNNQTKNIFYAQKEIWWCKLGINVGYEQDGKDSGFDRPVLILKGLSKSTCMIVPLTSSDSKNKYRIYLGLINDKNASVVLSQIKVIDTKRLINKISVLDENIFQLIRKSVKDML